MQNLIAYLTENIKFILLLTAVVVVLAIGWSFANAFPIQVDPLEPLDAATEDINIGVGELQEIPLTHTFTFANVLTGWERQEDCEKPPNLRIEFDVKNTTSEPLPLPGPDFGFLLIAFSSEQGHVTPLGTWILDTTSEQSGFESFGDNSNDVITPGEQVHYGAMYWDAGYVQLSTGDAGVAEDPVLPDVFSNPSLLILGLPEGLPEIAGNFADTADGETGHIFVFNLTGIPRQAQAQSTPITVSGDSLAAGFQNFSIFSFSDEGSEGYMLLPSEIDPASPEYPNLVFTIPEVDDQVLLEEDVSNAIFVFTGGAPAGWSEISQYALTDFDFIDHAPLGMALILPYIEQDPLFSELPLCTATTTPTSAPMQASSTYTPASGTGGAAATATPRPTQVPERTQEPTKRNTPKPTPRPTQTPN